jgi:hypothetical protein
VGGRDAESKNRRPTGEESLLARRSGHETTAKVSVRPRESNELQTNTPKFPRPI